MGRALAIRRPALVGAALAALMGASLVLRTGTLDIGYWIDEGISVGIASHGLTEIPRVLAQDGNPPLYYLLLHGWMAVAGTSEAATRALSLVFALLAVPASFWAGSAVFDRRAGALAAIGAAGSPYLTAYAQETRMYSLVVLLSILASASFALAFVRGRRGHVIWLGVWLALLLYTHTWGVFLTAAMGGAWLLLWRRGLVEAADGVKLGVALALVYAPWVPSLVFQATHTGAPWSTRPSPLLLLGVPGGLFGRLAAPLLLLATFFALLHRPPVDRAVRVLAAVALTAALLAWLSSQVAPGWTLRYHAVVFGPLLLALAPVLARGPRLTVVALVAVVGLWLFNSEPPAVKSNVRTVSAGAAPVIRPGDLVVTTQPEQVPALYRYLPGGVVYLTPMGLVSDPRQTDWRNGLARLRAGRARTELLPAIARMDAGRRILLVTPVPGPRVMQAPWQRAVRVRTREWRQALRTSGRVRSLGEVTTLGPKRKNGVRAELFEIR